MIFELWHYDYIQVRKFIKLDFAWTIFYILYIYFIFTLFVPFNDPWIVTVWL